MHLKIIVSMSWQHILARASRLRMMRQHASRRAAAPLTVAAHKALLPRAKPVVATAIARSLQGAESSSSADVSMMS